MLINYNDVSHNLEINFLLDLFQKWWGDDDPSLENAQCLECELLRFAVSDVPHQSVGLLI